MLEKIMFIKIYYDAPITSKMLDDILEFKTIQKRCVQENFRTKKKGFQSHYSKKYQDLNCTFNYTQKCYKAALTLDKRVIENFNRCIVNQKNNIILKAILNTSTGHHSHFHEMKCESSN